MHPNNMCKITTQQFYVKNSVRLYTFLRIGLADVKAAVVVKDDKLLSNVSIESFKEQPESVSIASGNISILSI